MFKALKRVIVVFIFSYAVFYFIPFSLVRSELFFDDIENKLWAHRMLDPLKDNQILDEFKGFEVDVFFNKNNNHFEVKHHISDSDYLLENYFSDFENIDNKYFWIDFKNLDSDNFISSKVVLDYLCNKYKVKDRIIIESKNIAVLKKYKESDYFVSYWLPNYHFSGSIFSVFEVRNNILKVRPNAISCDYHSLHFYTKKFPNYTIHCWTNEMVEEKDKKRILKISKNKNIRIILTDFKDNFLKK